MKNLIKLIVIVLILDFIFLYSTRTFFNNQVKLIQGSDVKMNLIGALLSYVCIIVLLNNFIMKDNKNYKDAFLLGVCVYGCYEYTNYAILKNWEFKTTIVDTLWGGTLFALTTIIYNKVK